VSSKTHDSPLTIHQKEQETEIMKSNFYRKIIHSDLINLDLPDELKHRQVELIILPYGSSDNKVNNKKVSLKKIRGIWSDSEITLEEIRKKAWQRT